MDREVIGWCVKEADSPSDVAYVRPSEETGADGWDFGKRYVWDNKETAHAFAAMAEELDFDVAVRRVVRGKPTASRVERIAELEKRLWVKVTVGWSVKHDVGTYAMRSAITDDGWNWSKDRIVHGSKRDAISILKQAADMCGEDHVKLVRITRRAKL